MVDGKSVHKMAVQTTYENLLLSYSAATWPWHFLFLLNRHRGLYTTAHTLHTIYHVTRSLFYTIFQISIPNFCHRLHWNVINCHRKCNDLDQRNMTLNSGKYNAEKRQISFKARTWLKMEVSKFLTRRGAMRIFLDILVVYQVTFLILFFIGYFSFTL